MFVIYKVFFILYMINKHLLKRLAGVSLGQRAGGAEGRGGSCAHALVRGLPGGGSGSASLLRSDGCWGSEPVRAQGSGAGTEVARGATERAPPPGVAHPEEGGDRAQRRGGQASGRERGPGDRAAGPEQAARGPEAAAGGGVRRPGGAAEESPGAGQRRPQCQIPGRLHGRGDQHASIPDYRGPNGVWTLLQKGRSVSAADLSEAEPTLTHMSIAHLHEQKLVQHVVSQNCDGLHLRSGLPRSAMSELHGNMYIEVCTACTPNREYVRVFDVTERTALHRHQTGRTCHKCGGQLRDTIVHFGERGTLGQPLNWEAATQAASKADTILCLGSSLKVLKKYPHLWCMTKPPSRRPKLYIVNLQWTPKDDWAALKLHGKCDDVMQLLMDELGLEIPRYSRWQDPIFSLATPLRAGEEGSHSRKSLCRSREEPGPGDRGAPLSSAPILGGWFGRGCTKRTKRKKVT